MQRIPYKRTTIHYDERITEIDEKICELIKKRKDVSNNNPGEPPSEYILEWAQKYSIYEDLLTSVFGSLGNEKLYRTIIEPKGFMKYLPVLKVVEVDNRLFTITHIRQYANASIINLNIDWISANDSLDDLKPHSTFELSIGEQYSCRMHSGSGGESNCSFNFVVCPPLPDDTTGIDLVFKEERFPFHDESTGIEVVISL